MNKRALYRFLGKFTAMEAGCWEWEASLHKEGYAQFFYDGKMRQAHRVAYEHYIGPIPEGLQLDHLCRNRKCVNPHHLEPVTPRENTLRGIGPSARNAQKTHCHKGHPFQIVSDRRVCRICANANNRKHYYTLDRFRRLKRVARTREWQRDHQWKKNWWANLDAKGRARKAAQLREWRQKRKAERGL